MTSHLKIGLVETPKRKRESIPTIHFQVLLLLVSGTVKHFFSTDFVCFFTQKRFSRDVKRVSTIPMAFVRKGPTFEPSGCSVEGSGTRDEGGICRVDERLLILGTGGWQKPKKDSHPCLLCFFFLEWGRRVAMLLQHAFAPFFCPPRKTCYYFSIIHQTQRFFSECFSTMPHDARMLDAYQHHQLFQLLRCRVGFQFLLAFTSSDPVTRDFLVTLRTSAGNDGAVFLAGGGWILRKVDAVGYATSI